MTNDQFSELSTWITKAGLEGQSESAILAGFCEREVAQGLPLNALNNYSPSNRWEWLVELFSYPAIIPNISL